MGQDRLRDVLQDKHIDFQVRGSSNFKYIFPYTLKTYGKIFVTPFNISENFHPPPSIINSVLTFVLRLSIFLNSPVCDNSPTSCSGNHL